MFICSEKYFFNVVYQIKSTNMFNISFQSMYMEFVGGKRVMNCIYSLLGEFFDARQSKYCTCYKILLHHGTACVQ